jgi:hypothetical protein
MGIFRYVTGPDDETLLKAAREALTHPDSAWFSDPDLFVSWGLTVSMNRDSGLVDVSNYERIYQDMSLVFPADVSESTASHWAVGWISQLAVRVLEPWADPNSYTVRDITRAFRVVTQTALNLREQYPVYDESDFSDREAEAREETRNRDRLSVGVWLSMEHELSSDDLSDDEESLFRELWRDAEDEGRAFDAQAAADAIAALHSYTGY